MARLKWNSNANWQADQRRHTLDERQRKATEREHRYKAKRPVVFPLEEASQARNVLYLLRQRNVTAFESKYLENIAYEIATRGRLSEKQFRVLNEIVRKHTGMAIALSGTGDRRA